MRSLCVLTLLLVAGGVGADDGPKKKAEKVVATVAKAKAIVKKAAEGEAEETKKALQAVLKNQGAQDHAILEYHVTNDTDLGADAGQGRGTVGQFFLRSGVKKRVLKVVALSLDAKPLADSMAAIFVGVNPDVTPQGVIDCITQYYVADVTDRALFDMWASGGYDAAFLRTPGAKALAAKFRAK